MKVTRASLRTSIHNVDHVNTVARRSNTIKRRVYSVPHPNALWHVDGNHKLIRWKLVVHAGVDGFSRMIVFMNCSNNNKSETALHGFLNGTSLFGLPPRVRTDHGGENVGIWRHMLLHYNDPSCVITGSSTHNERVERMWRDMRRSVISSFASTFFALESEGLLDPLNHVDIFCLHYVFLPRIQHSLQEFQASWNLHGLSTEGRMSPTQLFFEGTRGIEINNVGSPMPISNNQSTAAHCSHNAINHVEVPDLCIHTL